MEVSRRGFIKITAASLAASSLGALGFGPAGEALAASVTDNGEVWFKSSVVLKPT